MWGQDKTTHTFDAGNLTDNNWNHVVMTFNGTRQTAYINGAEVGHADWNGTIYPGEVPTRIGRWHSGDPLWFDGEISDLRIYNRALTEAEIKSEMYRYAIPDSSCKGMWRLDEGKMDSAPGGLDVTDISGNGNHGTCVDMGGDEDWVAGPPVTPLLE